MKKIGFVLCVLVASTAFAAEEWQGIAGFSGLVNTGNAENTTLGGNSLISYKEHRNQFTWSADGAYGRSTVAGVSETNTNNWRTILRYDRFVSDPVSFFSFSHVGQNRPSGFELRYGSALGLSHFLYQKDKSSLKYEAGFDYTREQRVAVEDAHVYSARAFAQYTRKINDKVYFAQDVESLFSLNEKEDIRLNTLTSLNVTLTQKMAFQVAYQVRFDNQPVAGFEKTDTMTQLGLNVNFL